jgi:hypothetical protein
VGSTEPFSIGVNPDSAQVKSIGIPIGNDRGFALGMTFAVQTHRFTQVLKLQVVEFDDHTLAAQPDCEICRPVTMLGVATIIMALAIMQEGKPR